MKLHGYLRQVLRKSWMRWNARNEALTRQRIRRGVYLCQNCESEFGRREVEVDHIIPVGPTPGSRNATEDTDWDGFIARMFCPPEGLAILCKKCHRNK